MGVLKTLSTMKSTNIPVENATTPPQATSPSPAVSSISSYGSGTLLIHGNQSKTGLKRKAMSLSVGRKYIPTRVTNIIWSGLFLMVLIATVIVVAALAENIRRTLWSRVSLKDDILSSQPLENLLDDIYNKAHPGEETSCIHRRFIWEHGSQNSEIIHDISTKWSAVVDHDEERCLIFDLHNVHISGCPLTYPWDMDLHVGVPACRGAMARIAPIRKIMHHICNTPQVNLSSTGEVISAACSQYKILQVDKVIIQYFDRQFRRVARRSIDSLIQDSIEKSADFIKEQPFVKDVSSDLDSLVPKEHLKKPVQTAKDLFNSAKDNLPTLIKKMKETAAASKPNSRNNERDTFKISNAVRKEVDSHRPNIPKNGSPKSPAVPSSEHKKTRFEKILNKIKQSKLNNVALDSPKNELEDEPIPKVGNNLPEGDYYWDVIYNSVDVASNKIFQAPTFKELIAGIKGASNANLGGTKLV